MKNHQVLLINLFVIFIWSVECIQLDNELVSKPQHCFERIALGAMLPFDKNTFRRTDTNLLEKCLNICLSDLDCKTFAFGISSRGNGTCQLSSKVIDSTGSNPVGTIFDPDFDLYSRKTSNCLVDPAPNTGTSQIPKPGGFNSNTGSTFAPSQRPQTTFPSTENTRPGSTAFISPSTGSYSTDSGEGSTSTGDLSTPDSNSQDNSTPNNRPSTPPAGDLYTINNRIPTSYPSSRPSTTGTQPDNATPSRPIEIPQKPTQPPPQHPIIPPTSPDIHLEHDPHFGPDPFPGYFPHTHPNYHYHIDIPDDKNSHFPGIYAHNHHAPSSPHDRPTYYPRPSHTLHPQQQHHVDQFSGGLYPSGRYPDSSDPFGFGGFNPNRKNGYQVTENTSDSGEKRKPCFRRVLAGKRIAPHWVRRTLICERLEDCQRECGDEKRFSCEGFNYRLDPSGRGQGDCELMEVPLSRMDLYSSQSNRDSNLMTHPDYDYYERDRTSTNCRASPCNDCGSSYSKPGSFRPPQTNDRDRYQSRPDITALDKYRPQNHFYESRPEPDSWDRYGGSNYFAAGGSSNFDRPSHGYGTVDRYGVEENDYHRPPPPPPHRPDPQDHYNRPLAPPVDQHYNRPLPPLPPPRPSSDLDYSRPQPVAPLPPKPMDYNRPDTQPSSPYRPSKPSDYDRPDPPPYRPSNDRPDPPYRPSNDRPDPPPYRPSNDRPDPPPYRPSNDRPDPPPYRPSNDRPDPPYRPSPSDHQQPNVGYGSAVEVHHHEPVPRPGLGYGEHKSPPGYHPTNFHQKPFIPYMIGQPEGNWGAYGGGGFRPQMADYWGLKNEIKRKDGPNQFNYFELGQHEENSVYNRYGSSHHGHIEGPYRGGNPSTAIGPNWSQMWTRRPGTEECSIKTSEGFRLHKGVVSNAFTVSNVKECEKMCYSEEKFKCSVFSFRYSDPSANNCLLCDRSFSLLDSYADIVPDKDFDIYAMSDDVSVCKKESTSRVDYGHPNDQCFLRSVDQRRLYDSIVRDSLTARSIGDCEIECIKAKTFTCRAFAFRYGAKVSGTIIDNCQLSDWPVRDMDKNRHLIEDQGFDVFERASFGKGCEIQPFIHDHSHGNKFCYLGYGSAAKLLATAIKKVISVSSELECKNECIRYRETSSFKCLSFSFGSKASSFNCELSDLDQSELIKDVHYTHTPSRDFWLFAWNPHDYTCRDKITTISGNRYNNERRMDIFKDFGPKHFTVSGRPCRAGTKCEKNHIAGFYSCELEGGEIGSWDFCCRDDHPCGFSRDFEYSWCFVGVEKEQWRSCSVSVFPPPSSSSSSSSQHLHHYEGAFSTNTFVSTRPDNKNDKINNNNNIFQRPPRPGGLHGRDLNAEASEPRLLPIQFLYHEGPPNATLSNNNIIDCNLDKC